MKKLTLLIAGNVLAVCPLYQADLITDEDSYGVDKPLPKAQHSRICFLVMHYTITDKPAPEVPTGGNVITHDLIINLPPRFRVNLSLCRRFQNRGEPDALAIAKARVHPYPS